MITIHGIFGSPFVRALRIALDEKGLKWDWAPFNLGEQKQHPYLGRQPFGKIPAIDDDGFGLYETQAMLRHIDRKVASPALIPADPHRAARMDQMLAIVDNYLFRNCTGPIGFNRIIAPMVGLPVNEAAVEAALPDTRIALGALAALADADGPFLTGETLSLADIAVLPHLDALSSTPEGVAMLPEYPVLGAWLEVMRGRKSVQDSALSPKKVLAAA
jgi:glutathione S-transferase